MALVIKSKGGSKLRVTLFTKEKRRQKTHSPSEIKFKENVLAFSYFHVLLYGIIIPESLYAFLLIGIFTC